MITNQEVHLTKMECAIGAECGAMRNIASIFANRVPGDGWTGAAWAIHTEGALGELAFCKAAGIYWPATIDKFKEGDVGEIQIRTTPQKWLKIRKQDTQDVPFVAVIGLSPEFTIAGWLLGHEGMKPKFLRAPDKRRPPNYFVPLYALRPMEELDISKWL